MYVSTVLHRESCAWSVNDAIPPTSENVYMVAIIHGSSLFSYFVIKKIHDLLMKSEKCIHCNWMWEQDSPSTVKHVFWDKQWKEWIEGKIYKINDTDEELYTNFNKTNNCYGTVIYSKHLKLVLQHTGHLQSLLNFCMSKCSSCGREFWRRIWCRVKSVHRLEIGFKSFYELVNLKKTDFLPRSE